MPGVSSLWISISSTLEFLPTSYVLPESTNFTIKESSFSDTIVLPTPISLSRASSNFSLVNVYVSSSNTVAITYHCRDKR